VFDYRAALLANMAALRQSLNVLSDLLQHTALGGLPLVPLPIDPDQPAPIPILTEDQIIADTTRATQLYYERLSRLQDGASAVANLLNSQEPSNTRLAK
jgi:hypothetical protein